ncbi:hypothetical protein TCON_1483 [Astathelohania contejeani]|uniref:Uncharacterized protein n=1 Tax=Astathelohania contejeani TaxID=164912 RepID=A0ABQ7HYV2_9MICR|nr:hypothetical protein TCON_1483 [Thelohania contejeani]
MNNIDIKVLTDLINIQSSANVTLSDKNFEVFKFICKNIIIKNETYSNTLYNCNLIEKQYILGFLNILSNNEMILTGNADKIINLLKDNIFLFIITQDIVFLYGLKDSLTLLFSKLIKFIRGKYSFNQFISNENMELFKIWFSKITTNNNVTQTYISDIRHSLFILLSAFIFSSISNPNIINIFDLESLQMYLFILLKSNLEKTLLLNTIYIYFMETNININIPVTMLVHAGTYFYTLPYQLSFMKIQEKLSLTDTLSCIASIINIKENMVLDYTNIKNCIQMYIDHIDLRIPILNYIEMEENTFLEYCIRCIFSMHMKGFKSNFKSDILQYLNTKTIQFPLLTLLNSYMYNIINSIINVVDIDLNQITSQTKKDIILYVESSFDTILEIIENTNLFKMLQRPMPENILEQTYMLTIYGLFATNEGCNDHQLKLPLKKQDISKNKYILDLKKVYVSIISYHLLNSKMDMLKLEKYKNDSELYNSVCKIKLLQFIFWDEMKELSIKKIFKFKYIHPDVIKCLINHTYDKKNYQKWVFSVRMYIANYILDTYHLPCLKHLSINFSQILINEKYLKLYSKNGESWKIKPYKKDDIKRMLKK